MLGLCAPIVKLPLEYVLPLGLYSTLLELRARLFKRPLICLSFSPRTKLIGSVLTMPRGK